MNEISTNNSLFKLKMLQSLSKKFHHAKSFFEMGKIIFEDIEIIKVDREFDGKLSIYDEEIDLYSVVYDSIFSRGIKQEAPVLTQCKLSEVRYFSEIAIKTKRPFLISDSHSEVSLQIDDRLSKLIRHSAIYIPILDEEKLLGVVSFACNPENSINEDLSEFFVSVANLVSIAISNLMSKKKIEKSLQLKDETAKALSQSEWKYRMLFETMAQGVIFQNKDGEIISANPAVEKILGFSFNELSNKITSETAWKTLNEDGSECSEENQPAIISLRTGKESSKVLGIYNPKENCYKWVFINSVPIFNESETTPYQVYATITDITEQKETIEKLRISEDRLKRAQSVSNTGNWELDLFNKTIWGSDQASEIYGLGITENFVPLSIIQNMVPSEFRQGLDKALQELLEKNIPFDVEYIIYRLNDKNERYINSKAIAIRDKNNKPVKIIGTIQDITDKRLAEKTLQKSEHSYQILFNSMLNGLAVFNTLLNENNNSTDFTFLIVNPSFEKDFGLKSENIIGKTIKEIIPNLEPYWSETFTKVVFSGEGISFENYMAAFDKYFQCSVFSPIKNQIVVIFADITERKRNEIALGDANRRLEELLTELRETQNQVLQQERLRSLGQMASGIAHDINNALTPILGYSDLLMRKKEIMKIADKPLKMIRTSCEDIRNTIERMREFYRPKLSNEEQSNIDLNKLIQTTVALTKHRWKDIPQSSGAVIQIKYQLTNVLQNIIGNESELREALTNIIINAADAMFKGGEICFKTYSDDQNIFLEIVDTGFGMSDETKQRCLDPFYTTKGDKGTGLGLSMVYGIMQRHSGKIEIISTVGSGTTIRLVFPFPEKDFRPKETISLSPPLPPLKILCIDDDESIRNLIKNMLEESDHTVEVAESGKIGLEMFILKNNNNSPYDLVITDLGMPYMDGESLARAVKQINTKTPIILMTGWGAFLENIDPTVINFVLKKPLTVNELYRAVQSVLKN